VKLLVVNHYPVFAGPHNSTLRLAEPLREHGWETLVVLPEEPGNAVERLRDAQVPVMTMPLQRARARLDPALHIRWLAGIRDEVRRLRRVIRSERIDLVIPVGLENPHGALAGRLEGVPVVWQIIGTKMPMAGRCLLMPIVLGLSDVLMTTGTTVARQHPGAISMAERLVPFLPPADVDLFRPDPACGMAARTRLGLDPEAFVVGTVGNLNPQKGHPYFVQAAARLRQVHPNVRFVILGSIHDTHPTARDDLLDQGRELGLEPGKDLIIEAPGDEVAELAAAFDVFWLSSVPRSEGVSTVVIEAMALGQPVVSTDVGGLRDVVHHGRTGYLVPAQDPEAMVAATIPLLEDPELRGRLGVAAREFAVRHGGLDACLAAHLQAFDRARRRRARSHA
jgi:glycosyltransferase involved in cell wall biosynthesis